MLKCKVNRAKHEIRVKARGTSHELAVETSAMIETIYQQIHKANPVEANNYKSKLIGVLLDPDSPVWKGE